LLEERSSCARLVHQGPADLGSIRESARSRAKRSPIGTARPPDWRGSPLDAVCEPQSEVAPTGAHHAREKSMRKIAVLSGLVLVGGLLGPSAAFAAEDDNSENRWIAVEDQFAIVLPDGETFTDEESGPTEELPPVGSQLFISEVLHETEDGETQGDEVGRSHIQCTGQAVEGTFLCEGAFVFDTGSQLLLAVHVDFSSETGPETFDIAVTGGTGDWSGATGVVSLTDISSTPEETVTLYEADVVLP
jgi:hypothetical protein